MYITWWGKKYWGGIHFCKIHTNRQECSYEPPAKNQEEISKLRIQLKYCYLSMDFESIDPLNPSWKIMASGLASRKIKVLSLIVNSNVRLNFFCNAMYVFRILILQMYMYIFCMWLMMRDLCSTPLDLHVDSIFLGTY